MGLAAVVLYNICLEMGDILPRSMDLTADPVTNKRRDREEVAATVDLTDRNHTELYGRQNRYCHQRIFNNFILGRKTTRRI